MSTQQPARKARRAKKQQQLVVLPQGVPQTEAKGKSIALALGMAPVLLPMITQAVTQVISAIKGGQSSGGGLRVRGPKGSAQGGRLVAQRAGPGNNAAPGFKTGMSLGRETARGRIVTFRDEVGTVTIPASAWGTTLAAGGLTYTYLSPVSGWLHPTCYTEGTFYTNFRPVSLRLQFIPTAGDTQSGTVVMGYVDSPQSVPATDSISTESKAMASQFNKMVPANKPGSILITAKQVMSWKGEFEVGTSGASDPRDVWPGYVFCYATNLDASPHAVGRLFVEAEYELMDRRPPFTGVGMVMQLHQESGVAKTEKDRARVRAKLADCLDLIVSTITERLRPKAEDEVPSLTEAELARRVSQLLTPGTGYDGGRGKPRIC